MGLLFVSGMWNPCSASEVICWLPKRSIAAITTALHVLTTQKSSLAINLNRCNSLIMMVLNAGTRGQLPHHASLGFYPKGGGVRTAFEGNGPRRFSTVPAAGVSNYDNRIGM